MLDTEKINNWLEEATLEELKQAYTNADSNAERCAINEYLEKRFNFSYETNNLSQSEN